MGMDVKLKTMFFRVVYSKARDVLVQERLFYGSSKDVDVS